jgi:hypothetical protein
LNPRPLDPPGRRVRSPLLLDSLNGGIPPCSVQWRLLASHPLADKHPLTRSCRSPFAIQLKLLPQLRDDAASRVERGAEAELNRRCGDGTVQKVEVLQYGDDPVIEPGQAMVRVILTPAGDDPDETLHAFEKAHSGAIEDLRKTIARTMPFIGRVQLTLPAQPGERKHPVISMSVGPLDRTAPGRSLTPVMARLDLRDVEVLDALITAGIVPNRAEGVRWALARIRKRPAYTQLREHIGKIDELKAQL